jgi:hypothetical protein
LTRSRFFDAYRDSFPSGPAAIASFYAEPCLTARGSTVRVNATQADTAAIMTAVDQQYRARDFTHGAYQLLEARGVGANAANRDCALVLQECRRQSALLAVFIDGLVLRRTIVPDDHIAHRPPPAHRVLTVASRDPAAWQTDAPAPFSSALSFSITPFNHPEWRGPSRDGRAAIKNMRRQIAISRMSSRHVIAPLKSPSAVQAASSRPRRAVRAPA